jgi:TonB family protein
MGVAHTLPLHAFRISIPPMHRPALLIAVALTLGAIPVTAQTAAGSCPEGRVAIVAAGSDEMQALTEALTRAAPSALSSELVIIGEDTGRPHLKNPRVVVTAMQRNFPASLRRSRGSAVVDVLVRISERGEPQDPYIVEPAAHADIDDAALAAVAVMRFEPAAYEGCPTPAWMRIPVTFAGAN